MNLLFECSIPGRCAVKKNTQRVVGFGRAKRAVYSKAYLRWEKSAAYHLNATRMRRLSTISCPLMAEYTFHFKNRQGEADVSNLIEGPQDLLQKIGIIENDKQIMEVHARKVFDGLECVEIRLYEI